MARHQINADVDSVITAPDRPLHGVKRVKAGAVVNIYLRGTTTEPTIYTSEAGGTTVTGPFKTDLEGRVCHEDSSELWVPPMSLDIIATKGANTWTIAYEPMSAQDLGGQVLDYAEDASGTLSSTSLTQGGTVWSALTVSFVLAQAKLVVVEFGCSAGTNNSTGNGGAAWIYKDLTEPVAMANFIGNTAAKGGPLYCHRALNLDPGDYDFIVRVNALGGGTAMFAAGDPDDGVFSPAWLKASVG